MLPEIRSAEETKRKKVRIWFHIQFGINWMYSKGVRINYGRGGLKIWTKFTPYI